MSTTRIYSALFYYRNGDNTLCCSRWSFQASSISAAKKLAKAQVCDGGERERLVSVEEDTP